MTDKVQVPERRAAGIAPGAVTVLHLAATKGNGFRTGFERRTIRTDQPMAVVIDIANGPWQEPDPPHSHANEQITYVAQGEILFLCEGRTPTRLVAGDLYAIPPDVPHSIHLLSASARLVDCFTPIRSDIPDTQ